MSNKKRVKVPVVLQMEATECGAASLTMVLAHLGLWVPLEKVRQECGVNRDGSKASNIIKAARRMGCEAAGYRLRAENFLDENMTFPLIIHWEFNHFVVLEGVKDNVAYLNDPAVGRRTVKWDDFIQSYTGIALEILPGPNFKKGGHRYSVVKAVAKKLVKDKWSVLFVILIGLAAIVPQLASPVMGQIFLDEILTKKHPDWMTNLCFAMVISFLITGLMSFLHAWCLTRWQQRLTLAESSKFFWHVLKLPMEFYQQRYAGEIASRVGFAESIAGTLSGSAATVVLDIFMALFFLTLLFQYSIALTLVGVAFSLVDLGVFFFLRRRMTDMTMGVQQEAGKAYGAEMNGVNMIESVKANGNEADLFGKIAGYRAKVLHKSQHIALYSQSVTMIPTLLGGFNTALIMTIGGIDIMEGAMTAGVFMSFQSLMGQFQAPFNRVVGLGQELQGTEMQMQRLNDVMLYEEDKLNFPDKVPEYKGTRLSGLLELDNISYGYSVLDPPLLDNISLTIQPGHWVAVVGASGSGKSTLGKVVTGLYKEWGGSIKFDGTDRQNIPREVITASLSSVDQDVFQITGTVRENISMFDKSIHKKDIVRAAMDACIHDDILQMDGGYEAKVGEGGFNFSGGQRQRLEIARALAVNPSLLVLDEATSALDPITELQILKNIRRRGCSCLVVAHRLSTIRDCDEIIVLQHGHIVERGAHRDMIQHDGPYSRLVMARRAEAEREASIDEGAE